MAKDDLGPVVEREMRFIEQVREMIDASVRTALKDTLPRILQAEMKKVLGPIVGQVGELHRAHGSLLGRMDRNDTHLANMARDFNRFAGWATGQGLNTDMINRRLEKIAEVIRPGLLGIDLPPDARPTPPAAPSPPVAPTEEIDLDEPVNLSDVTGAVPPKRKP